MSLLSPTEARAFQSFLSTMSVDDIPHLGSEALAKKTKDLMSLDDSFGTRANGSIPFPHASTSTSTSIPYDKRPLETPNSAPVASKRPKPTPPPSVQPPSLPPKQPLLTPTQKKANHIQSEQKRRANIRRGYEALCAAVPALREAIRAEEDDPSYADPKSTNPPYPPRRKRQRTNTDEGEKIDGRAGPRSENVVLSKTIEYITQLLAERNALLTRLRAAHAHLPPGHLLLPPYPPAPRLWEREWRGGSVCTQEDDDDEGEE
ncbi:hypothetical protein BD779DRAFT_1668003 [Infundibulicybe gibba]|nr:hypothetical protein BD779DRAFT_1668003 [Infundibulicybe gibba]